MIRLGTTEAVTDETPGVWAEGFKCQNKLAAGRHSRRGEAPTMPNDFTTLQSWDTLNLSALKKTGTDEQHGPCPITSEGKDCFWIQPERKGIGCRSCSLDGSGKLDGQQFKEHLEALGMTFGERDDLASYDWTNYLTGETVTQTRTPTGDPKYRWPTGTKTGTLVYLKRYNRDANRPIVFCEGAKAATFAAAKLPADDYDVIGFVSASKIPDDDTITALTSGRSCIVWPDDDLPGANVATRLCGALGRSALDGVTVDPALLGLTGGRGHDAEQWRPDGAPVEAFRAACVTAQPEEASCLPRDTPGRVRLWIEALTDADLDAQLRVLHLIAESPEWASLVLALRIAVVGAIKRGTATSMAAAILGRFDDRTLAWREPPTEAVDTSEPDVVSLATLLADPPDPAAVVARGLAFGGTMGFIHGPKASGKTTILAAAAARVSRGQPWAGQDTEAGTVLVVCNDDPRSWTLALRDFGADTTRILMARARVVSRPGKLAALLAKHTPAWVIIDNMRTWCRSMQADTDNSSAAADAIDPIAEAIRECGYPVACTIVHNEARSKGEGTVVKGVPASAYLPRLRNSTVFEDAADWIVGCAHADGSTKTTITCGEKTRREILTETLTIDLNADGHGTPSTGGGGADPFTVGAPVNPLDEKITGYLMANPDGVSQNAVLKAVGGRRPSLVNRLKVVGTLGPDKLWRCASGRNTVAQDDSVSTLSPPPEQVSPEAQTGGGENRDAVGCVPVSPANGTQGGTQCVPTSHPIRDAPSVPTSGTHLVVPDLLALAGAKITPPAPPQGGDFDAPATDHEGCPKCNGTGRDLMGKPCDWDQFLEDHKRRLPGVSSVTHVSGFKRWDNLTSTWVDTVPSGDVWMMGLSNGVHLADGTSVTDGDPRVHWGESWNDIELEQKGMVH